MTTTTTTTKTTMGNIGTCVVDGEVVGEEVGCDDEPFDKVKESTINE